MAVGVGRVVLLWRVGSQRHAAPPRARAAGREAGRGRFGRHEPAHGGAALLPPPPQGRRDTSGEQQAGGERRGRARGATADGETPTRDARRCSPRCVTGIGHVPCAVVHARRVCGGRGGRARGCAGGRSGECMCGGGRTRTLGFLTRIKRVPGFHPDCRSAAALHSAVRAKPLWRSRVRVSPRGLLSVAARSTHTLRLHH